MNVMMMLIMMAKRTRRTIVLLFQMLIKLIRTKLELVMHVTMIATEMASRTIRMFVPAIVMRPNLHLGT